MKKFDWTNKHDPYLGGSVQLKKGEDFKMLLSEPSSTGYTWKIIKVPSFLQTILNEATDNINANENSTELIRQLIFKALEKGIDHVELAYKREWESEPPVQNCSLRVEVTE